jgi:hypothetical protein
MKKLKRTRVWVIIFQLFNGLSALAGGFGLMSDTTGQALGMEMEMLQGTPFPNFLIPGIVLFTVNGLGNIGGFLVTIQKHKHAGEIAALFGAIMMIWIIFQVAWLGYQSFLQPLYFSTGLIQAIAGWYLLKGVRKRLKSV